MILAPTVREGAFGAQPHQGVTMPTISRLLETALYVEDLERSAQFYQKVFGFESIGGTASD